MGSAHEVLKEVRALIADPADWCQGAIDEPKPGGGMRHCSIGALGCAANWGAEIAAAKAALYDVIGLSSIATYNDHHSHECVLAAFDAAIEKTAPK